MKESVLVVFKQIFENEPIELFSLSEAVLSHGLTTPYVFFYVMAIVLFSFICLCFIADQIDNKQGVFGLIFALFIVVMVGVEHVRKDYIDKVVREKFIAQLTQEQIDWLESEKIKRIKNKSMQNDLSTKQSLDIEPIFKSIKFKDLEIILKRDD